MPAPKGNNFNPKGPPEKPIDWKQFEDMCEIHCTQQEIANILRVDEDTLRVRVFKEYGQEYSAVYKKYSSQGKCSLRRSQYKMAHKNPTLSIWLGKNWLDQKDNKDEIQISEEGNKQFIALMTQISCTQKKSKDDDNEKNEVCE